jgi:site-specific DNA recombinase
VTQLHIGMLGTMAQLYLSELREKTRRGLMGRVLAGRSAGGLAYGYRVTATGERAIEPSEADVVRRIFRAFAAGQSPRAIAKALNADRVPGPDGRPWIDTTIRGQRERGTGLLNNDLYAGRLVWNRVSYVKDPRSGKRQARPNPPEAWERAELPELRIVDQPLWDAVKARQDALGFAVGRNHAGQALNRAHRRRFLLSGLLVCGVCRGGYTVMAKDRYGCAAHRQRGTCANDRTILREEIESRVLSGLKERLLAPELFAEFAKTYQEEVTAAAREQGAAHQRAGRALADCDKRIAAVVQAIEDGLYSPALKSRMAELEAERARLAAALEATSPAPPVALHPNLPALYRRQVERLEAALNDPLIRDEAAEVLRDLIQKVVLVPRAGAKGLDAVLHGDLARILQLCEAAEEKSGSRKRKLPGQGGPGSQVSVVAGAGFEPATFRL